MSITNFNKKPVNFDFKETKNHEYKDLKELYKENGKDHEYLVLALYVNDGGQYGKQPLAVSPTNFINLPTHLVDQVEDIRDVEKLVDDINNCKVGFKIYEYEHNKYGKCYSINWIDIEMKEDNIPF